MTKIGLDFTCSIKQKYITTYTPTTKSYCIVKKIFYFADLSENRQTCTHGWYGKWRWWLCGFWCDFTFYMNASSEYV